MMMMKNNDIMIKHVVHSIAFLLLQRHYSQGWALASFTIRLQASRSLALSLHSIAFEGRNLEPQHWGYSSYLAWSWRMEGLDEWVNVINFVKCFTVSHRCVNARNALYLQVRVTQIPWKCNAERTLCSCRHGALSVFAGSFDSLMCCYCHCLCAELYVMSYVINLLAPEFGIKILAHPVCKMWIIQKSKKVALWNKWHFEEKKT